MLLTMDSFQEYCNDSSTVIRDDKSIVFVKGTKKGMLVRPYQEDELVTLAEKGWQILKNEVTPKRSKIMLVRKCQPNS
jgi:hypothetical protein